MKRINVNTNKSYDIIIDDSFRELSTELSRLLVAGEKCFIVTDKNVEPLYMARVLSIASSCSESVFTITLEAGENNKCLDILPLIYDYLLNNGASRSSVIIALGGGVIGDLAGFAAATYMRGIKYVQIPTTLLSQVDSSIGGKTAVDFKGYKNIIGAFYQPDLVHINTSTLKTLPAREFSAGMAEVIKYGLIADADFYKYLIDNINDIHDSGIMIEIISKCAEIKARIVEIDEGDNGIREILNFGHTIGHSVEALSQFNLLHGEAVALGMSAAIELSKQRGAEIDTEEYYKLIHSLELPLRIKGLCAEQVYDTLLKDKKYKQGKISYILLEKIGRAYSCRDIRREEALNAIEFISKGD